MLPLPGCHRGSLAQQHRRVLSTAQPLSLGGRLAPRRQRLPLCRDAPPGESRNGSKPTGDLSVVAEPAEAPPARTQLQLLREARIQPLKEALQASIAQQAKAATVREALEAEVVALFERVVNEEGTNNVNVEDVAAKAMAAVESAVKDEVEAAAVVEATQNALEATLKELQVLDSTATNEKEAASAAHDAVVSMSEELTAAAQAEIGHAPAAPSSSADGAAAVKAPLAPADTVQLLDNMLGQEAVVAPGLPAAASTSDKPAAAAAKPAGPAGPRPPSPQEEQQAANAAQVKQLQRLGLVVAAGIGLYYFVQSAPGQAAISALQGVADQITDRIGPIHVGENEKGLLQTIWLLLTSCIMVPAVVKLVPGGSPVLGYLLGGVLVGPFALNIISDIHSVEYLGEMGVVLLLFNIGLELSLERLASMAKYVFGMGGAQVLLTTAAVAGVAHFFAGLPGPSAIVLGGALAMSTTAVAIQILEERGEMGSRHGRGTFSVLLLQDLAVVVLLMLIPLLAPDASGNSGGLGVIAQALGLAAIKAVVCIGGIIAAGRTILRPLYKKISGLANAEIFAATTLLVVLSTSLTTQLAGLSLALGAFLAGLLLAETEYALQVESDIAPYKGLLMGLFFMTVGMQISVGVFMAQWQSILLTTMVLIVGKLGVMMIAGTMFGVSQIATLRAGLLLAAGGEFAFVAFGEAISKGLLTKEITGPLYIVVALSMALVPYLATLGAKLGAMFERHDMKALQPQAGETKEMKGHVIVAGYGRVGQVITQMLSEELIDFVALDVSTDRVQAGKSLDLPVYFGDAGSPAVLHQIGAERASCAVVTLDTPGANYRTVWALHKHYPHLKIYVKAHDVNHGINLEKAGARVVVPETLEPSLQLAAAVLQELNKPAEEVNAIVDGFRKRHLSELQAMAAREGTSLGYATIANDKESEGSSSGAPPAGAALSPAAA